MLEPTTLQIPYTNAPFLFATSIAASVSAVSPLCDIAMTTSFSVTTGFEYLNSLAYSTVTGMRQKFSIRYLPISPACHEVPQATIIIRFAFNSFSLLSKIALNFILLLSSFTRPRMQFLRHSGCSNISFSIK